MKIGIDGRAAKLNSGSELGKYTKQIVEHFKYIDRANKYYIFLPQREFKDMYRSMEGKIEDTNSYLELLSNTSWQEQPSVDVFHNTINGIGIPEAGSHKLVITINDLIPYVMPETVENYYLDYMLKHTPGAMERADKIITVSSNSKKDIKRYFHIPDEDIKVIYNAPDKVYQPINKDRAKKYIAQNYNITDNFILYGGGFGIRKNLTRLIRSFSLISKEFEKNINLVIIGKPAGNFDDLINLSKKLSMEDKVIFLGDISQRDLIFFYNSCEAFVYPSLYEGFPTTALEAAACATPIIASNVSSIPEVMGECCTYVNPYNVLNIAQGIYDTVYDQEIRKKLSEKALSHSKKFSWENTAKETLDVYKKVFNKSKI